MSRWASRAAALAALLLAGCELFRQPAEDAEEPAAEAPAPVEMAPLDDPRVPREALRYRDDVIRNARAVWGLEAPVATFAGQIQQESAWRPDARSPYAAGLTQFTPATADWISKLYPDELAAADVFNPAWAIRALVRYDRWLWERNAVPDGCERMAFVLAAYNGGPGWIDRERKAAAAKALDSDLWFDNVETVCLRAGWACTENRAYPVRILRQHEPRYASWGTLSCGGDR